MIRSVFRPGFLPVIMMLAVLTGCNSGERQSTQSEERPQSVAKFDPCSKSARDQDAHCDWKPHWEDTGAIINALDGTKTEFLLLESTDPDGFDFGQLHYATLKLCFKNGKPCGGTHMTVAFEVHGVVRSLNDDTQYQTSVRFRFDNEPLMKQVWTIADSRDAFGPSSGKTRVFISQLLRHKKLILEFSYDEHSPRTLTFDLSDLTEKIKSTGLSV